MPNHTPLPWNIGKSNIENGQTPVLAKDDCGRPERVCICQWGGIQAGASKNNAEFIVRAVNNHTALLEACQAASGAYEALKLVGADKHLPGFDRCLADLNAVIAKAKED